MSELEDKMILFYDGDCGLCSRSIRFLFNCDKNRVLYFAPLQGDASQHLLDLDSDIYDTVYFRKDTVLYHKSSAVIRALGSLNGLWSLSMVLLVIPTFIRDYVYDFISRNRESLLQSDCLILTDEFKERILD